MRRAARLDDNHGQIVEALRNAGASVLSMAALGKGVPDLLVWHGGTSGKGGGYYVIECKDGAKSPSHRVLTPDQVEWIARWRGPVHVVLCPADALRVIGVTV